MTSPWSFSGSNSNGGSSGGLFGIASVGGLDFPSLAEAARVPYVARLSSTAATASHSAAPVTSSSLTSVLRSSAMPPPVTPPRRKQLPAMTSREIDTVLRMHLKHLEMSDPYIEDYYNLALKAKREGVADFGAISPGDSLGARLLPVPGKRHPPLGAADMRGHLEAAARSRASGAAVSGSVGGSTGSLSRQPSGAQTHTDANLTTLASALGTLQRWTPNAPRKLVKVTQPSSDPVADVAAAAARAVADPSASAASGVTSGGALGGGSAPPPLALRKDEGVAVRMAVEAGYDILADIWDVVRRRRRDGTAGDGAGAEEDARLTTIEELIDRLYAVLRLPEPAQDWSVPITSTNAAFFVRMCAFAKGKRFIAAALPLLPLRRQQVAVAAVMRHLGALADVRVAALQASSEGGNRASAASPTAGASGAAPVGALAFWPALVASVRDDDEGPTAGVVAPSGAAAAASSATMLLDGFLAGHSRVGVVAALTSGDGARLLYACLERIPPEGGAPVEVATAADRQHSLDTARRVCVIMTFGLPEVFSACESPDAVWLVVALLDALAGPDEQSALRATLTTLLESGRAPPPPPPPQQS